MNHVQRPTQKPLNSLPKINAACAQRYLICNAIAIETDDVFMLSGFACIDFQIKSIGEAPFAKRAQFSGVGYKIVKKRFSTLYPCHTTPALLSSAGLIEIGRCVVPHCAPRR